MEESNLAVPATPVPQTAVPARTAPVPRWLAIMQVIAVCGIPTQFFVAAVLWITTNPNLVDDTGVTIPLEFMAMVMLLDTALIALLIRVFLEMSGEDSRTMFLGKRPIFGEIWRGLAFVPVVFIGVTAITLGLRALIPGLHTVAVSPYAQYMGSALDASIFIIVVVLGAGVKEELQRAFILSRFEQCLGGIRVGLITTSVVFGVLHTIQGLDAAIVIGLLGLFWGVLYVRRRSAVMSITNHAAFDAAGVLQYLLVRSLGG